MPQGLGVQVGNVVGREQIAVERIVANLFPIDNIIRVGRGRIVDVDGIFFCNMLLVARKGAFLDSVAVIERRPLPTFVQFAQRKSACLQQRLYDPKAFSVFGHWFLILLQR